MKVYVVGKDFTSECTLVANMFASAGWKVVDDDSYGQSPIHLVCFVGGADVNPALYGEENKSSYIDEKRDEFEKEVYERYLEKGVPMVGVCRGGQFLNVMNGGKLIQNHGLVSGIVDISGYDELGRKFPTAVKWPSVKVDHHQGILAKNGAELAWRGWNKYDHPAVTPERWPVYAAWYKKTRCLCFQPHPEWGHGPTKKLFFGLIEEYLNLKGE